LSLRAREAGVAIPSASEPSNFSRGNRLPRRPPTGGLLAMTREDRDELFRLAKAGFANRRKLLIKNLLPIVGKQNREKLKSVFAELGLSENARAQELGVEDWVNMVRMLKMM
jgi:16S rRNA A1518/A1519 N6-dimethyltransferase RsmA/KsgA/DIM1 with predicted DNA glycosylase/AP lyase activity